MKNFHGHVRAAVIAGLALLSMLAALPAKSQTVTQLPTYIDSNGAVQDLGNGPQEVKVLYGNLQLFTQQSSGLGRTVGSGTTTTLSLNATPLTVPCVGCAVSGTNIPAGITVSAYTVASALITLSSGLVIAANTTVSYGAACPATVGSNRVMLVQAGVGGDLPLYTTARLCAAAQNAPGATLLLFPIGAH